jgi:hypothetical protein
MVNYKYTTIGLLMILAAQAFLLVYEWSYGFYFARDFISFIAFMPFIFLASSGMCVSLYGLDDTRCAWVRELI